MMVIKVTKVNDDHDDVSVSVLTDDSGVPNQYLITDHRDHTNN